MKRLARRTLVWAIGLGWVTCALDAGPDEPGPPAKLSVRPQSIVTDETTPRNLILVTVLDAEGRPIPSVPVEYATADSSQVMFPHPEAVTNDDGVAANFLLRVADVAQSGSGFHGEKIDKWLMSGACRGRRNVRTRETKRDTES